MPKRGNNNKNKADLEEKIRSALNELLPEYARALRWRESYFCAAFIFTPMILGLIYRFSDPDSPSAILSTPPLIIMAITFFTGLVVASLYAANNYNECIRIRDRAPSDESIRKPVLNGLIEFESSKKVAIYSARMAAGIAGVISLLFAAVGS